MKELTWADLRPQVDGSHAAPKRKTGRPYFLHISSLENGRLDLSKSDRLSEDEFVTWTRRVIPQSGDLLYSYETRLGEAALMPDGIKACLGRRMALLRPNPEVVDPKFLLYFYLGPQFQRTIQKHTITGATVPRLLLSEMPSWTVVIPPLEEQRGIAEVLGALDDKIAANAVSHEAASRLAIALAQSDQSVRLDQVADQVKGTVAPASFGAALVDHFSLPAFDVGAGPEVVAGATIKSNKTRVAGNTVLISKLNPRFPRIWNVIQTDDSRPALASTEFIPVTSKLIPSSVLWAALSAPGFASALESKVAGTSGSHQRVKPADLLATEIADPRSLSAGAITSIVSLGQMRDAFMAQTGKLVATRDALLPLLMSGKVKVKDAESVVGDVI